MSGWTLDQWTNVITLLWMGFGFVYLAATLKSRTRRWNGVGIAMTVLTLFAGPDANVGRLHFEARRAGGRIAAIADAALERQDRP